MEIKIKIHQFKQKTLSQKKKKKKNKKKKKKKIKQKTGVTAHEQTIMLMEKRLKLLYNWRKSAAIYPESQDGTFCQIENKAFSSHSTNKVLPIHSSATRNQNKYLFRSSFSRMENY